MIQILDNADKTTFYTNATIIYDGDKKYKTGTNRTNNRYQNVIYDTTFLPDYWFQTKESIYDWTYNYINKNISPVFLRYIQIMNSLEPFNGKEYVPYRLHLNYLPSDIGLTIHLDSSRLLFTTSLEEARLISLTYYLEDHIEGTGGELYSVNGFVYKPKANTAIGINGGQTLHGVTQNVSDHSRLAFTTRWAHIDDLFLPGHPDKHLYKIDTYD